MAGRKPGRTRTREEGGSIRALDRGLAVLEVLAEAEGLSLSEIARRVHLSTSTTSRVLDTLRRGRFVAKADDTGFYRVGVRAFEVGAAFLQSAHPQQASQPVMKALAKVLAETVNLAVLDDREVVYIEQVVEGKSMMRMFTQIGARAPLHCTGAGKVLLAWLPESEVYRLLGSDELISYTPHTLSTVAALKEELTQVRNRGYALDDEERELGVRCVTAPVRSRFGEVVAALSLSAPVPRLSNEQVVVSAEALMGGANEISTQLGYRPPSVLELTGGFIPG